MAIESKASAAVDCAIVETILPMAYELINALLDAPDVPKVLRVRAGRLLPAQYKHSFTKREAA